MNSFQNIMFIVTGADHFEASNNSFSPIKWFCIREDPSCLTLPTHITSQNKKQIMNRILLKSPYNKVVP